MKRALLFIFMTVCVLGMSACSSKDAMPETSDSASNPSFRICGGRFLYGGGFRRERQTCGWLARSWGIREAG